MNNDIKEMGIRTFFNICEKWDLKDREIITILGSPSEETFNQMKSTPADFNLDKKIMERIAYILNIHASLKEKLSSYDSIIEWINEPKSDSPFNGKSALDVMLCREISDLSKIKNYLSSH